MLYVLTTNMSVVLATVVTKLPHLVTRIKITMQMKAFLFWSTSSPEIMATWAKSIALAALFCQLSWGLGNE